MQDIIQLKVTLRDSQPPIWRSVLVESDISFEELHLVFQYVMGWETTHEYCFDFNGIRLSSSAHSDNYLEENKFEDASAIRIGTILKEAGQKFDYEYDSNCNWSHEIIVENFLHRDKHIVYPVCIEGEMNCPPEDCGGINGYYHWIEILNGKDSPEKEELISWVGDSLYPEEFNLDYTNRLLSKLS